MVGQRVVGGKRERAEIDSDVIISGMLTYDASVYTYDEIQPISTYDCFEYFACMSL